MKIIFHYIVVWFALASSCLAQSQAVTEQLVWQLETNYGFINGQQIQFEKTARVFEGRTLLPVRDLARAFDLKLLESANGFVFEKLSIDNSTNTAKIASISRPVQNVAVLLEGQWFVVARALELFLPATVRFDSLQRSVSILYSRDQTLLPVARFTTDKTVYRLGEPVKILEFSYDPNGIDLIAKRFEGRSDAYFETGIKTISLVVTNRNNLVSETYSVSIEIKSEVLYTPFEYGLVFTPIGQKFLDPKTGVYPVAQSERQDSNTPLILSDSPEEPNQSGLLYEDSFQNQARVLAYHVNPMTTNARLLILARNASSLLSTVQIMRHGVVNSTSVVATLGRVSLLEFFSSLPQTPVQLEPNQSTVLFLSDVLTIGKGLNVMFDLDASALTQVSIYFLEDSLVSPDVSLLAKDENISLLRGLPILSRDANHQRGTFLGVLRHVTIDLTQVPESGTVRQLIGDGKTDPNLQGVDALTNQVLTLKGNYAVSYNIDLLHAENVAVALASRGGPYAGAIRINGALMAVPESGLLLRNDVPVMLFRSQQANINLELIPASGSFLPIQLLYYQLPRQK